MKKNFLSTWLNLRYNFKTLLFFELLYRLFGVVVIFPLFQVLFYISIRMTGSPYITNRMLISYILRPTTMLLLLLLIVIFSIYVFIEMVMLSILFDHSHHQKKISFKQLIKIGSVRIVRTLAKHRSIVIISSLTVFFFAQAFHYVGFASTLTLPREVEDVVQSFPILRILFNALLVLLVFAYIELMFYINILSLEGGRVKTAFKEIRLMLKKRRLLLIVEFAGLNIVLNLILYLLYALIIAGLALLIYLVRGQEYVLGLLLTGIYTFYLVATTVATIILVPINYGLVSTWYYRTREKLGLPITVPEPTQPIKSIISPMWFKRIFIGSLVIIFFLNITSVFTVLGQPSRIEYLKNAEIIAHRGAALVAPENTLSALEIAIEQGADAVEFDVLITSDDVPILMHDVRLGRTTNDPENRLVSQVDLDTIKTLDAGSWFSNEFIGEEIPTLEEAFQLIQGRAKAYIDLKATGSAFNLAIVELIETYDMVDEVKVMSFNYNQLRAIKRLNPEIETVLLVATFFGDIDALINDPNIDHFAFRTTVIQVNAHFVNRVHQSGKRVYVWTVEDRASLQSFVRKDVDGLIVKDPVLARQVVYSRNIRSTYAEILETLFRPQS